MAIERLSSLPRRKYWPLPQNPDEALLLLSEHPRLREEVSDRLWRRVERGDPDECWRWYGSVTPFGYGRISVYNGFVVHAHRLAFFLENARLPRGGFVCHRCDNPPCCNPAHLFEGTNADNIVDMHAKGRNTQLPPMLGENNPRSRYTAVQATEVKRRIANGEGNTAIARALNLRRSWVESVRYGKVWAHITTPTPHADQMPLSPLERGRT